MKDVFISYKHEDREKALLICQSLERAGLTVWWDDQITPRSAWDASIERAITQAKSVLVLWSPKSIESEWVRTEAHFGREHDKLVPAVVEACQPPLAFRLVQAVDLQHWNGDAMDRHWRKLLAWLTDLKAPCGTQENLPHNPFRDVVGETQAGEPIFDGLLINSATPPGALFIHGEGLPVMRIIPRGSFLMGGADDDPDRVSCELPRRRVTIAHAFAIGIYPILTREYRKFRPASPPPPQSPARRNPFFNRRARENPSPSLYELADEDHAVTCVTWNECTEFCRELSLAAGAAYRLPSEAEWEYACRGGSSSRFVCGSKVEAPNACFAQSGNSGSIAPGHYPPNGYGLYDMHGNVREWTLDRWRDNYEGAPGDGSALTSGHSAMRVTRGGCWQDPAAALRSSARGRATESIATRQIGFRVVADLAGAGAS